VILSKVKQGFSAEKFVSPTPLMVPNFETNSIWESQNAEFHADLIPLEKL
jgi:hypothetical protein